METKIAPRQRRTIEVARCIYCDRGFYLESNQEIARHQGILPKAPFPAGFVYQNAGEGLNITTHVGGILSDLEFGEKYTHDYMHYVATCKNPLDKRLKFDGLLKVRTARDLREGLEEGRIWVPTLQELETFRNRFRDYLAHEGYGDNEKVYEALMRVGSKSLN